MNNETEYMITCTRCGAEMSNKARYCMKCGNLNIDHEKNENMKPYLNQQQTTTYSVGSGQVIYNTVSGQDKVLLATNTGSRVICFIVNFLVFLALIGFSFMPLLRYNPLDIETIRMSTFPFLALVISILFLYIYSLELIFMKCNKKWWAALIPFYNYFVLSEITFKNKYLGVLGFIPIVGLIYLLVMFYKLGEKFKYGGIKTVLFSFIFVPLMGFGTHNFDGYNYVDSSGNKAVERNYKLNKLYLTVVILVLLVGLVFTFWNNITNLKETSSDVEKTYYVNASKQMVIKVKGRIEKNYFSCDNVNYSATSGRYYFYFADVGKKVFLPLYYQREPIEGYVLVDNTSGESKYYVSMTDYTYGFPETLYEDITYKTPTEYTQLTKPSNVVNCEMGK